MSMTTLTAQQEEEAQQLAARAQELAADEFLQMARTLVSKEERQLFGQTELDLRDILLRVGAKMYELYLAQKKTATSVPASSARTVSKRRNSRTTARKLH
jgi:hypothetical protein